MRPRYVVWFILAALGSAFGSDDLFEGDTAIAVGRRFTNETLGSEGQCWNQWVSYWNASSTPSTWYSTKSFDRTTTATIPINVGSPLTIITTTYMTVLTATVTAGRSFVVPTETYLETQSLVYTETVYSTAQSTIVTTWESETVLHSASAMSKAVTTPGCSLPSPYPPCQSEWEAYLQNTGATSPACTQASVNSEACRSIIYARGGAGMLAGETAMDFTTSNASSTWWPAESSFAPGCTLGCQTCAITGRTVRVFYWPPSTATAWENGTLTATLTENLARPSEVMVAVVDNSTLTSPTVYVSYDVLYASNSCSGLGKTYRNTIVPLSQSADLSSLVYVPYQGENNFMYSTREFNFNDLQEPIPDKVFEQLPSCAREYQSFSITNFGGSNTTAFTCERHGAYAPLIAVPTEVQNIDPLWKSCTAWYGGLFDPPSALQGVPVAATPTEPSAPRTTPPKPLATVTPNAPEHTHTRRPLGSHRETTAVPEHSVADDPAADPQTSTSANIGGIIISAINGGDQASARPDPAVEGGTLSTSAGRIGQTGVPDPAGQGVSALTTTKFDPSVIDATPTYSTLHNAEPTGQTAEQAPGGTTQPLRPTSKATGRAETTLAESGKTHTVQAGFEGPMIDGQTVPLGYVTTVASRTVSFGASEIFIDGSAIAEDTNAAQPTYAAALTLNGETLTAWRAGGRGVAIGTVSVLEGERTSIDGVRVSLVSNAVIVGSQTVRLSAYSSNPASAADGPAVQITVSDRVSGMKTLTASPVADHSDEVVVDGTTLSQGASARLVDGLRMSLGSGGVVYTLPASSESTSGSRSSMASSAIIRSTQTAGVPSSSGSGATTTAAACRSSPEIWMALIGIATSLAALVMCI